MTLGMVYAAFVSWNQRSCRGMRSTECHSSLILLVWLCLYITGDSSLCSGN